MRRSALPFLAESTVAGSVARVIIYRRYTGNLNIGYLEVEVAKRGKGRDGGRRRSEPGAGGALAERPERGLGSHRRSWRREVGWSPRLLRCSGTARRRAPPSLRDLDG